VIIGDVGHNVALASALWAPYRTGNRIRVGSGKGRRAALKSNLEGYWRGPLVKRDVEAVWMPPFNHRSCRCTSRTVHGGPPCRQDPGI